MFEEEVVDEKISLLECHCNDCNSKFLTTDNNKFTNCIFCNSTNIEKIDTSVSNKIKLIPFKKEYKDVITDYNKKVRFNPLIPLVFKNKKNYSTLQKVYVPVFVTNISRTGEIEFIGGENGNIANDKVVETRKYSVLQKINLNYLDVLLNISSKIDDEVFNIINNYDFFNIVEIDNKFFDDSFYLYEDISLNDISNKGKIDVDKHSIKIIRNNVKHSMKKLKSDNTKILFENTRELLVPVYIMKVKYNNKEYSYMMNGESGKSYINMPISIKNIIVTGSVIFIIVFLLSYLLAYFL